MAKPKITMEVSERDKKLLIIVLAVIIVTLGYVLGYQKFTEANDEYADEYRMLKIKQNDLEQKIENIDEYKINTQKYIEEYNKILSKYNDRITQPWNIDFLNEVERTTDTWLKSVSFSEAAPVYTFGQILSSNPDEERPAYNSDLTGYKTTLSIAYEADYENWKKLISFINTYYSKMTLDSISMNYSDVTGMVTGSITLSLYTIIGNDGIVTKPEFELQTGTDNIFDSSTYDGIADTDGNYILNDYDYYVLVNPSTSSVGACVAGIKDNDDSRIINRDNTVKEVEIVLSKENDEYRMKYSIDGESKESSVETSESVDVLIMSSLRVSEDDLSEIKLTLKNNTDIALNVKLAGDDVQNSRVKIEKTTGTIVVY